jgi:hypothetical protein
MAIPFLNYLQRFSNGWPRSRSGCPTSRAFRDVGTDAAGTLSLLPRYRTNLQFEYTPVIHFHRTGFTQCVSAITAPMPQFRRLHQPSLHRIAMHITQLLRALFHTPHIEVIKPRLPQMLRRVRNQLTLCGVAPPLLGEHPSRESKFDCLQHDRRSALLRFAHQQVKMFGHDHVANYHKMVLTPHLLEHSKKEVAPLPGTEQRLTPVTTARDEVKIAGSVIACEPKPILSSRTE